MSAGELLRALSLWQPWASLVALGHKRVETRGYPPSRLGLAAGEVFAIHAAKNRSSVHLATFDEFDEAFRESGLAPDDLPLGALVATARLLRWDQVRDDERRTLARLGVAAPDVDRELRFGDYAPGRWAWLLGDVRPIDSPVAVRGRQGLFRVVLRCM